MPNDEQIARDLTVIYLQNNFDKNLSPEDLIEKYKETYEKFEDILRNEPVSKVQVLNRKDFGL
ncbi:hypothetical protein [Clostridium botulinum]|uniref:hypothetical protein n=1 Tax=Clostridium botulinum TaxID=1491 RepID=UPI003DA520E1